MWASWCPPCKEELPYFQSATDKYKNDDVEVLMVNLTDGKRETQEKALEYMNGNNFSMNLVFDKDYSAADAYTVNSIPMTLFIDKEGNLVYEKIGMISEAELNSKIDGLLKK